MCMAVRRHWKSNFARFIQSYGVDLLALKLDVHTSAIYHWIRGATTPRPAHAEIIQRFACERGSRLSFDEIYGHSREVRADEIKLETGIPPRRHELSYRGADQGNDLSCTGPP
jgi:hypothetical protein